MAADFWGAAGVPQTSDPQPTAFASGVESDKLIPHWEQLAAFNPLLEAFITETAS
jgi:hypothetical protein